jgi:hypothetical protein
MINKLAKKIVLQRIENEFLPKLYKELYKEIKLICDEKQIPFSVEDITFHWEHLYLEFKDLVISYGIGSQTSLLNNIIKIEQVFFDLTNNTINYRCSFSFVESDYGKDYFFTETFESLESLLINIED